MRSRASLDDNKTMRGFVVHVGNFRIKRKSTTFSRCTDCNDFSFQGFYIMIRFLLPVVVLLIPTYSALPFEADQELKRETRQAQANSEANCDFSLSPTVDLCDWSNLNLSAFKWQPSSGQDSYWIGGPNTDQTDGNKNGGYAFFETSQLPNVPEAANTVSAMLLSPTLESTGSKGHCVSFR